MDKICFIGDSFLADVNEPWTWPMMLAKDIGHTPINFAIIGASNFNIWHQLEYATDNYNFDKIVVCLTAPNRIESVSTPAPENVDYTNFKSGEITSWALHERIMQNELSIETADLLFDHQVAVSKDKIIAKSIIHELSWNDACVFNNLFEEFSTNCVINGGPREFSDVVTGELNEPVSGHLYRSAHTYFYNKYKDQILSKIMS